MERHYKSNPSLSFPFALKLTMFSSAACALLAAAPDLAPAATIFGDSYTVLRMRETTDKKNLYPLYEYLQLTVPDIGKNSGISFDFSGWGRVDLRDKTTDTNTDGNLRYAYLSYRPKMNNMVVNLGRFSVTEGVAAQKVDGIYVRSDLKGGFGASAFVGNTVETRSSFKEGDLIYGGRLTHGLGGFYTLGLSALKEYNSGSRFREEAGADLWLHPAGKMDVLGRSTYNAVSKGWMEHTYSLAAGPFGRFRVNAEFSRLNYKDYFFAVTTSALSLTNGILDPTEEVSVLGGGASYRITDHVVISGDYKNYNYKHSGTADYYGGKVVFLVAGSGSAGASYHRMDGKTDRLRYDEYRVFAAKKLGKLDLTVDFFDIDYAASINNVKNSYTVAGAAGYELSERMKVSADVAYSKNPDFDNEVQGLVKFTYRFGSVPGI